MRRSRHFRIADLSCQRCSLEILCSCRPQRQVATADSSLKPSRLIGTDSVHPLNSPGNWHELAKTAWDSFSYLKYLRRKGAAGSQFVQASK